LIRSRLAGDLPGLAHAHSTRADGSISPPADPAARLSRDTLVRAAGGVAGEEVAGVQVHETRVAPVDRSHVGRMLESADGLVTSTPGLALLVKGADCPLGLVVDPVAGVLAVFHSGWRGTVGRIAAAAVREAVDMGAGREHLTAAVFPGIGPCCFEVGEEVRGAFTDGFGPAASGWFRPPVQDGGGPHMDLHAAIAHTLTECGVARSRIDLVPGCTACDGRLWSYRASGGGPERHGLCAVLVP